ncbi:LacI family DNA-binding transcriptional regulator [Paenibacillus cookii]|uniref:LacI family transcriptional regulator n=1 Tax=Paenibacillus cookii TaxID=157839 RepID=A0ABQ4LVT7_9BACL|nr:LacI family DNA-binding transcriptional regulator [Paenibacillus cookii]KHF35460.1 HTH-type transcriptional repressor CytR [Paenibacillus sp. P1XP2]GIO67374.1 LacI family transcriptional regulator [Paenibacillus cookii]
MAKLKDIAERVGVSISTVSRAISNDTSRPVNEETKRKIREAAQELGYPLQEELDSGKPGSASDKRIACVVPQPLIENHPYFSEVLAGFHDRMNELGHPPAIVRTLDEVSDAEQIRNLVKENGIRGVVIISWYDQALIEQLEREKVAVLGVSLNDERLTVPVVDCDRIFSARTAVRHLIDQGHRRIGFIGGPAYSRKMDNDERFIGYKFAMMEAGLPMQEDWIINTNWNVDLSYSMLTELLVNRPKNEWPTAMFCASDMLAIPAMRAVVEQKARIPQDIAFVGMDDISFAQYTNPPLTSVHVPKYEIGKAAAQFMMDYLDGDYPALPKILLPCRLMIRESSNFVRRPEE